MKVIIAGSRDITDPTLIDEAVLASGFAITEVVCGMARGVDILGLDWANRNLKKVTKFEARWQQYGAAAGHFRNREMGMYANALIAVWDGRSKGTADMIRIMDEFAKERYILIVPKSATTKE